MSKILESNQDITEVLLGLTGQKCQMGSESCIDLIARYVLEIFLKGVD
jgi:hypothetical protein